jgi:oxygen-dependent protoporphyrinogen oxidase
VFDFAARRIGRGAAETFVDPVVSGIFGGVARQLSLPACFPVMREMELRYGGLVRALVGRQIEKLHSHGRRSSDRKRHGGPAGPAGRLTSFRGGLDLLVVRLSERLAPVVRLGRAAEGILRDGEAWRLVGRGGESVLARRVILACPAFAAARILEVHDRQLSEALGGIPYAPIAVVASGHRRQDIAHPLDGFGFLIPHSQGLRTLGSIWTSSIFAERAPSGHVQFRTMLGGAGDPQITCLSDEELWATVRRELGPLVGMGGEPAFLRTYRWEQGIPQFVIGHRQRRAQIEEICRRNEGLHVVGNAYYGVGLNDCVKMARRVADAIMMHDLR